MRNAAIGAARKWVTPEVLADADVVLRATWISVWGRWFIWLIGIFLISYRPGFWYPGNIELVSVSILLFLANGLVHYRLVKKKPVTWRWLSFLGVVDVALVTFAVVVGGGFEGYVFVAYYPALAIIAVVSSSFLFSFAWTAVVAVTYTVVCLVVGSGPNFDAGEEKQLVARLAVMLVLVLGINLVSRFERTRWRAALSRERQLRRERIELSQTIHDTTAQTAYMIGLGVHRVRELAGESNDELVSALDATAELARSAMWQVRGPIDAGHIVEGRELGRVLWSHCATFEKITAVPTEVLRSGSEPPLATETRSRLFSIAHNALTNAFLHGRPRRVEVGLHFEAGQIRLSVSDDGVGLPDDYAERGRGFQGMRADAEQMGAALIVEGANEGGGTTITCLVPNETAERGD